MGGASDYVNLINLLTGEMQTIFKWVPNDGNPSDLRAYAQAAIEMFNQALPDQKANAYEALLSMYNQIYTTKAKALIDAKIGNVYDTSQAVLLGQIFDAKQNIALQWYNLKKLSDKPVAENGSEALMKALESLKAYTLDREKGRYLDPRPKFFGMGVSREEKLKAVIDYYDALVLKADITNVPKPKALLEGRLKGHVERFVAAVAVFFKNLFTNTQVQARSLVATTTPTKQPPAPASTTRPATPVHGAATPFSPQTSSQKNAATELGMLSGLWDYVSGKGQSPDTRKNTEAKTFVRK